MGREIRRVPKGWEHLKDEQGKYMPMFDKTYLKGLWSHIRHDLLWYLKPKNWRYLPEWFDCLPSKAYYRRRWRKGEAVCYQVYENVTEGTPVSPVFNSLAELIEWGIGQGYSREAVENFARDGRVPSMVIADGQLYLGIESAAIPKVRDG